MKQRKQRICLLALVLLMVLLSSNVEAQSSRVAFVSERGSTDLDLHNMRDDGSHETQLTSETLAAQRPSYSRNGQKIVYDVDGDIYIIAATGGSAQSLTDGLSSCSGSSVCEDADAGPHVTSFNNEDFLIVFTRETIEDKTGDIFLATVDVSAGALINIHQLTDEEAINYHPTWCGDDHIVWSRELGCEPCGASPLYWWELCFLAVDEDGATEESPTCYLGGSHQKANQHPSCNAEGTIVAFAQSPGDSKDGSGFYHEQPHQICTMDLADSDPVSTVECFDDFDSAKEYDENKPVWSPGDSQLAFASNKQPSGSSGTDYEIWAANKDFTGTPQPRTNNDDPDDDPDWGSAPLP